MSNAGHIFGKRRGVCIKFVCIHKCVDMCLRMRAREIVYASMKRGRERKTD